MIVFRLIQAASVFGYVVVFGSPMLIAFAMTDGSTISALISAFVPIGLGAALVGTNAPRLYDPSKTLTVGRFERREESRGGRWVRVNREVGADEIHVSSGIATRNLLVSVLLGVFGLVFYGLFAV